jgi:DNA-binding transcriptional LysR family regulator
MRITLDQLETFDNIVRLGSFNAAARKHGLTQPTVSQRIRELESALKTQLFVRHGPRIRLTSDGEALRDFAQSMLRISRDMAARFDKSGPLKGNLRFGTTDTFAQTCLIPMIKRVEEIYPGIKISVFVDDSSTISRLLECGEIDTAIISQPNLSDDIVEINVGRNQLAWVAGMSMALPLGPLQADLLASHHIVISAPPSRLHQTVLNWFADANVSPARISASNNISVIIQMALAGTAISVLPISVVRAHIDANQLRVLEVSPSLDTHNVSICYRRDCDSIGLTEIIKIARELISEHRLYSGLNLALDCPAR